MNSKVNNRATYHRGNFTGNLFVGQLILVNLLIVDRSAIEEDMHTIEQCMIQLFGKGYVSQPVLHMT